MKRHQKRRDSFETLEPEAFACHTGLGYPPTSSLAQGLVGLTECGSVRRWGCSSRKVPQKGSDRSTCGFHLLAEGVDCILNLGSHPRKELPACKRTSTTTASQVTVGAF